MDNIPVYRPYLHGNERKYVNECLDSSWISSKGTFIQSFEEAFRRYVQAPFATTVCNGTVALHLALIALGVGPGDEVIVPTLTFVASVNAIAYVGATPVFADVLESTWQIDPQDVQRKITSKTKAIIAVHLYGHPCEISLIKTIADRHGLFLIEDCAEAFGAHFQNQPVGSWGNVATYSFFGNKTITTGEGGMISTHDVALFEKICTLKNQGNDPTRSYWHTMIGYNYRMTNISAAIGLAQLEQAQDIIDRKRLVAKQYQKNLQGLPVRFHQESQGFFHSYWMVSIAVAEAADRDELRKFLASKGIETRPFFFPIHQLPMYFNGQSCPVAEKISPCGMNLPSYPDLTSSEIDFICKEIAAYYHSKQIMGTQRISTYS